MESLNTFSEALKTYICSNSILKMLLPMDIIFLFGGVGAMILNHFVSLGLLYNVSYYLFFLGVILSIANSKLESLYIGFFAYAALGALRILGGLFNRYSYLNYDALFIILIFGGLGYFTFRSIGFRTHSSK